MRIVIDLQGAQNDSRSRGIGRYSLAFAQALARQAGEHELWLALNGRFGDTIEPLRAAFDGLIPQERIRVFEVPGPTAEIDPANAWRARAAERIREAFVADLRPDIVHISSLFEGWGDDTVTSVGEFERAGVTSVTLYDLIPYLNQDMYLADDRVRKKWYFRKLQALKNADLFLAISESSRREAIEHLRLPADRVVNVSAGLDPSFRPVSLRPEERKELLRRYGLEEPFILYTCVYDRRKNVEGLIHAFSLLPEYLRARFRLALAGTIQEPYSRKLKQVAARLGLPAEKVIFTGFVPDEDLVLLCNLCYLFIFPSLHEGFGLPALEAMACGAAVIGSNTSSIPEVIGRADALFDPTKPQAIAEKMAQALTDEGFRQSLREHGLRQAKKFTWDACAKRALDAFRVVHAEEMRRKRSVFIDPPPRRRPRLAYVSPLPPARSGIADYSAELLPELAKYYDIEIVAPQREVSDPWIVANFPLRSPEWFVANAQRFERILYHLGNSEFHAQMLDLLRHHPGVVVLHDFYLSGLLNWLEVTGRDPQAFSHALYLSHGYAALAAEKAKGREQALWTYPSNLEVLERAWGVIVHSRHAVELARAWYGFDGERFRVIPQPVALPSVSRDAARARLGLGPDEFLVCSFGMLTPTKMPERILSAWLGSSLARDGRCCLVFVGEDPDRRFQEQVAQQVGESGMAGRVQVTGFAPPDRYKDWLAAADVAVQLRAMSRGETSRAILDCLAYGVPLIVNAHGSAAELTDGIAVKLDEDFRDGDLAAALERLWRDPAERARLSAAGRDHVRLHHAPGRVTKEYWEAIETWAEESVAARRRRLVLALADVDAPSGSREKDLAAAAVCVQANRPGPPLKQILVDVSVLSRHDAGTGIHRVTRAILLQLLARPPAGYRVEPVYGTGGLYRYARSYTLRLLGRAELQLADDPVEAGDGDVFLGLDLAHDAIINNVQTIMHWRNRGVKIVFIVHDLLPALRPDWFPPEVGVLHQRWLTIIASLSDALVCISRSVVEDLRRWLDSHHPVRHRPLALHWSWSGADIESSLPSAGLPADAEEALSKLRARPTFLMVGTVEPRKGYAQALNAFEQLWVRGTDVNLAIVGREGWMVADLVRRLRGHPELGRRLLWLEGISDEFLQRVYQASTVLLAASEAEGFGLPLVEAARHGLPIIARDIPVFREIAGEHAFYFKGLAPEDLASAIERWLALYREGKHPRTEGMTWLTWEQSAERLKEIILEDVGSRPNHRADAEQAPADVAAAADRSFPGEQRP